MASGITVKVAMRPLFVDYLKSIYNTHENNIVLNHTPLGTLVKELLTKTPANYKPKQYPVTECAEFELPYYKDLDIHYNNYLSLNSEKIIQKWAHEKFYTDMRDHVDNCKTIPNFQIKVAVNHFCDMHNIHPDHYKNNSLYRDYYRYSQRKKSTRKFKKMSSTFAAFLSFLPPCIVLTLSYVL